jgi:hypothetical protein
MALYPKKLNNTSELAKEKKRVQQQLAELSEAGLPSVGSLFSGGSGGNSAAGGGVLNMVMEHLPVSMDNPVVANVLKFIRSKIGGGGKSESKGASEAEEPSFLDKAKKTARAVAVDVVTGYLKWKAIELSYKGVKYLIKQRKEKRAAESAQL